MIRRYLPNETTYLHNKYVLSPIGAEVLEEANGMFELEIEVARDVILNKGDILSAPTPRGEQPFRVYRIVKTLKGKKAYARHLFYDLANNFLVDVRPTVMTCDQAIKHILANTEVSTSFTGSSDYVGSNTAYYIRKNPVEAIIGADNSLLNTWGGNLVRNGRSIQIKANSLDRGFEIRLGKNLIGIEDDSDESNVVTRLYPTVEINQVIQALPEKYVDSPQIGNYPSPIIREIRVALTEDENTLPLVDIYSIMRTYCDNLYSVDNIDKPLANYKIDFVQLGKVAKIEQEVKYSIAGLEQLTYETIETLTYEELEGVTTVQQFIDLLEQIDLYDLVSIRVKELNLKAKVIKYRYDSIKEKYINIELGGFRASAKYQTANIIKQIQTDLENQKGFIAGAIDYATEVITGNKGGFVITRKYPDGKPYEILIMDTDDINTAMEVIRFNNAGIGFSHTGYNGPFETSIIAGQVVSGTGFFNSIVTNLIQSDIGSSLNLESNVAITSLVGSQGDLDTRVSTVEQTSDQLEISFSKSGGTNLLVNSGFANGLESWAVVTNDYGTVAIESTTNVPSERALAIPMTTGLSNIIRQLVTKGFNKRNKDWKLSGFIRNTASVSGATNPYAGVQVVINYVDASVQYLAAVDQLQNNYFWKYFNFFFATDPVKEVSSIRVDVYGRDMSGGAFYASSLVLEEGRTAHSWKNADNEAYATFHKFTPEGYEMKDANGSVLIEVSKGIANEQNIVLADNVEDGYPMKIPFHLGTQVSVITEAKLKWKNFPFRTYSKGAASGGGSTSGASSRSTTDATWDSSGVAEGTSSVEAYAGLAHQHTISLWKLAHSHGIAHTHSTPAHAHLPEFGILEASLFSTRYAIDVWIDGVFRTTVDAGQGEVDVTNWITTTGWHEVELRSLHLKRISATLFLKTYIRR